MANGFTKWRRGLRNSIRKFTLGLGADDLVCPSSFNGKSVAVVGPAERVEGAFNGAQIDACDIVIRMNRGPHLVPGEEHQIGSRTDMLFHNLSAEGERSVGHVPDTLVAAQKIRTLVHTYGVMGRTSRIAGWRSRYRAKGVDFKVTDPAYVEALRLELGGLRPTTGLLILSMLLRSDCRYLLISGFSFFNSGYQAGYQTAENANIDPRKWAGATGIHDPDLELELFRKLYREAIGRGLDVRLEPKLKKLVASKPIT